MTTRDTTGSDVQTEIQTDDTGFGQSATTPPVSSSNRQLQDVLAFLTQWFPSELPEINQARIAGWEQALASGERTFEDLRSDIFKFVVGAPLIQDVMGVDAAQAERLISGEQTFQDFFTETFGSAGEAQRVLGLPDIYRPPVSTGTTSIYDGADLYRVANRDGAVTYYAVYEYGGVRQSFRIGDQNEFTDLFPDADRVFNNTIRLTEQQYANQELLLDAGEIDEVMGQTGSWGANMDQAIRQFGEEAMPSWIRDDPRAVFVAMTAANEGWSEGRTLRELSRLDSFKQRFGAWGWALEQAGGDETAAMQMYTQVERGLRSAFSRYRQGSDVSNEYLGELMQRGWTAENAVPILQAEQRIEANPQTLDAMNRILVASGRNPIGKVGAIGLLASATLNPENPAGTLEASGLEGSMNGNDPADVFDLVNDAIVLAQLEDAGMRGLDMDFVRALRNETEGVLSEEGVRSFAQTAAANVMTFARDIDLGRYGLSEESITAAAFGRSDPEGRSTAEVASAMQRIVRERQAQSRGLVGSQSFIDQSGRLVARGLSGL